MPYDRLHRFTLCSVMFVCLFQIAPNVLAQKRPEPITEQMTPEDLRFRQAFFVANGCDAAYESGSNIVNMLRSMGVDRYEFLDFPAAKQLSDTQVLVATLQNYTLVCFRGTQELADWKTNITLTGRSITFHEKFAAVRIHSGFHDAWLEVRPSLLRYLDEVGVTKWSQKLKEDDKCHEVLIGGHSLGGALAAIGGIDLIFQGYHVLGIYTFGQPKVFGSETTDETWKVLDHLLDIQRFVFRSDPVPSLPTGYVHIGHERYSKQIGSILASPRTDWFWPSVNDHRMTNYVKTISALIETRSRSAETRAIVQWLKNRNAPLTKYLDMSPREAQILAGDWSTQGGGGGSTALCGRRIPAGQ
jgi:hypothetical protein